MLNIIFPIFVGSLIYIFWRIDSLLVFKCFKVIGIDSIISGIRDVLQNVKSYIPEWIIYNLPNALWIYSFIVFILFIWKDNKYFAIIFSLIILFTFSILIEIFQLINIVPGTFDVFDIITGIIAGVLAFFISNIIFKKESN